MSGHVEEFVNEPNSRGIWWVLFLIIGGVVLTVFFVSMFYKAAASDAERRAEEMGTIGSDLKTLREYEEEMATTTKWIDKSAGVVQIPIESAMDLVVASYKN